MNDRCCFIETTRLSLDPRIPQQSAGASEEFASILQMRNVADIPVTPVRLNEETGTCVVVCEGKAYTTEGLPLKAAKVYGFSTLPCRIVGGEEEPPAAVPAEIPPPAPPPARQGKLPVHDAVLDALFREIEPVIDRMAAGRARRTTGSAQRVSDQDDWKQEALLALWRELVEQPEARLRCADDVRGFIFGVLCRQAARTMKTGALTCALAESATVSQSSALEELIGNDEDGELAQAMQDLRGLVPRAKGELHKAVARLPVRKALAVFAWLDGDGGYRTAGAPYDLTLAQMRRCLARLLAGYVGVLLRRIRRELEVVNRVRRSAARDLQFGRLRRLLKLL